MKNSTSVQPLTDIDNQQVIDRLVDEGADAEAASGLVHRISHGNGPSSLFDAAALKSMSDLIVAIGGRLESVS